MRTERDGEVWLLVLDDDDNRMHDRFVADLDEALDGIESHPGPAALVVTGEGKHFSNGLDLEWLVSLDPAQITDFFGRLFGQWARVLTFPMVTVAALNGHAFAAGAMMSLACDLRIMRADRGWWCLPEADMGMPLQPAMHAIIGAKLAPAVAHDAIVLATRYTGPEAHAAGIVHAVASADALLGEAVAMAAAHAAKRGDSQSLLKTGHHGPAIDVLTSPAGISVPIGG